MNTIRKLFQLNPEITYLNHGSFGASPYPIFENYQYWQRELEKEPVQFITKTGIEVLQKSKEAFADFFSCSKEDIVFVSNPSTAFNTVIKSLNLQEGEEILSTNLEYGAMDKTWKFYCEKYGATYLRQEISLPIQSKASFLKEFWSGLTSKTKYVFLSQITSATALILPVKEICKRAKELGLITLIDGAHVPGHIPLNIKDLDPDYYTGALHKWFLAPKGFSFLYVKKKFQNSVDPLIVSWGYDSDTPSSSQFLDYHEYSGTRDISAFLTMPALLDFWKKQNWANKTQESKNLILKWYPKFCFLLDTEAICPIHSDFLGQICSIPIRSKHPVELKEVLYTKYKIEIPITNKGNDFFLRISMQPYNSETDLEYLYVTLKTLKSEGRYLS